MELQWFHLFYLSESDDAASVAVLELLAAAAGAGVVTAGESVLHDGGAGLLGTGVVLGSGTLVLVGQLLLVEILLALGVLLTLVGRLGSGLLHLLYDGNLGAGQDGADAVVHLVDHRVPYLG